MARKTKINITLNKRLSWGPKIIFIISGFLYAVCSIPASATYVPFNTNVNQDVGIGTSTPQSAIAVASGNVGIGTWTADGGNLIVNGGGNVGIGSAWPGQVLDVNGSARATGIIAGAGGITLGGVNNTSWPSGGGGWTLGTSNVGISTTNNVGIGTNLTTTAGLTVMNGNVGIGTWVPAGILDIEGTLSKTIFNNSNVGIGTTKPSTLFSDTSVSTSDSSGDGMLSTGFVWGSPTNTGGSAYVGAFVNPGTSTNRNVLLLKTAATTNDAFLLRAEANGVPVFNVNASGNVGMGTYSPMARLSIVGNIGIGTVKDGDNFITTSPPNGGMIVEGDVGIGTWAPGNLLDVHGNVGIGSSITDSSGSARLTITGTEVDVNLQ